MLVQILKKMTVFYWLIAIVGLGHISIIRSNHDIVAQVDCMLDDYQDQLRELLPETLSVKNVFYDIDFVYTMQDLSYITGLKSSSNISLKSLYSACFYLKQLDRFERINLIVFKNGAEYDVQFKLIGKFVFSHLSLSGCVRDRDFYKNMYLLDVADVFDIEKHRHSIDLMKSYFYDRGYCNVQIFDMLKRDHQYKTVSVKLELVKGIKFLINNVVFDVQSVGSIAHIDVLKIKKKIEDICLKRLQSKVYSQEVIKKMKDKIKHLLERYGFMNFDISFNKELNQKDHTVSITCVVVLEQKKDFVFFGNHFFNKQEILDHLLMYGKSSWHFPSSIIVDELVQLYKSRGFWHIYVSVREEKNRVFCLINEGDRIVVSSVLFRDNDHFSAKDLERQAFKKFLNAAYFDKDLLKKSIDLLIRFYRQHGFWDIKVIKEDFVRSACNPKEYQLILTLEEGKQRKIGTYTIVDYPELEKLGPFSRSEKEFNTDFDQTILLEQKQWLLRHFRNLGYSKASVDCELQESDHRLNIIWTVALHGQAVKFGKVLIVGNSIMPAHKIMREVACKQAEAWDKSKIDESLKRLRDLEIFDVVQIYPSRQIDDDLQKPIFVKVIDANRCELRTRMGYQQVGKDFRLGRGHTYKIGGTFLVRNPFNVADRLVLEGDFTRYYRNAAASYQFPRLFKTLIRCQYKLYDTLYDQPVYIGSKCSLYQAGQRGFLFNMTRSFTKTTVSGNVGIEFMGIKEADEPELQNIIDYDKKLLDKKIGYVFFEPNLMWQKVDSLTNPKKGHLSFVSCKGMIDLDTKTSFFKLLVEHSFYVPLREPLILAVRMRGGHIFNRRYNQIIPIERFYLGGASTLRGYARDYCPPLGLLTVPVIDEYNQLPPEACSIWRFAPQGGRTMINLNTELRFKLYRGLGAVVFNDVGALFKDSITTALKDRCDNFLGGSGFGFRYDTPIGPLRFDLGFKWNRVYKDFEPRCAWYLTFGHAF